MPVRSRAQKQRKVIQCVTRTRAECLGASFGTGAVETRLGTEASAGSCADPNVAILTSVPPKTCPGGSVSSYSIEDDTDKSQRGNQP